MHYPFNLLKVTLFIFILSTFALAQSQNYKILGISVAGNRSADVNSIINNSGLRVGDQIEVPGEKTLTAIRRLHSLNIFSDIKIEIEKEVGDGVFLIIRVDEFPRIERAVYEGNDELSDSKIEEKLNFIRGQILKPQEVQKTKQKLLNFYEEEGFLNAEVTAKFYEYYTADTTNNEINVIWRNKADFSDEYTLEYNKKDITYSSLIDRIKDRLVVKFSIVENDLVTVREIFFVGNKAFDNDDLKGTLKETETSKWWKFWSSAQFDKKKFEEDKEEIVRFYHKNGYRDADVLEDSLVFLNDKKDVHIYVNVYEGPQYRLRDVIWEGNTIYEDEVLDERLDFKKGDVYNWEKFEQNLRGNEKQNDISALYLDNGYLTFGLRTNEVRLPGDSIDVYVRMEEKNQFKIGDVGISGNDKTKDKVLRRELYTVPGDYFNRALLLRSVQQLGNLQYFNVEKLYGPQGLDYNLVNDSTVNVTFRVEEKSSDYLNASVGYSGSYGFSGSVGFTLTNFSLAEPFRLGGGQQLSFNWQFGVSSLYRTFTLGFTEPWMFDTPTMFGFEVFDTRQQYIYDLRQSGGTLRVGRRLKWPDDYFYIQGLFRYQYNNVLEGQEYYKEGKSNQFTLGATISRRDIDNPIFPSQGSSIMLDAELSGGPILPGDVDYFKIGFKAEWYNRLFNSSKFTLYTSADLGYLEEIVLGTNINPYELYYMGGNGLVVATTPLRGYEDRTVGPRSRNDDVLGGKAMAKFTTEFRVAVTMDPIPLYLLAFAEAGNVFESFNTMDFYDLRRSVGIGARIMINPIGLIGFDLGYGFDRKITDFKDPAWIFHFQFGKGF